ncbi:MAG: putative porin, partial [Acidobacteriota bacterium]
MTACTRALVWWIVALSLSGGVVQTAGAQDQESESRRIEYHGDFRIRLEQDWDSVEGDGTERQDRLRLRVRVRLGVDFNFNEWWSARIQLRSGQHQSQQSPHITIYDFDGGDTGPYQFDFDYWNLSYKKNGIEGWVGRNQLSFWHQDDLFLIDNVTFAGVGGSYSQRVGGGRLIWRGNYVALPVGMRDFSGTSFIGQLAFERELDGTGFTIAAGVLASRADADDAAGDLLLTENNTRDYNLLNLQFQHRSNFLGRPLRLGGDYSHNFEDYGSAPSGSFSAFHRNDLDGFVLEALWGRSGAAGDWLVGYFYSHVEALAANSSYIQDDWARWGNSTQARLTNMKGSELRLLYTIGPKQ